MVFKIIDLPVTLGRLGFIKVLKYLKEGSLDKKQLTSDRYKHICKKYARI